MIALNRKDITASIPVFLLGVPLCLGIAHASGVPLVAGLLSGIIGGLVASGISKSTYEVTGPSAAMIAVTFAAMNALPGFQALLLCVALAGIIQILLGKFKAGFIVRFVPNSVMKAMLFAIGLILIVKEIPHLLGYDIEEFGLLDFFVSPQGLSSQYPHIVPDGLNSLTMIGHSLSFFHLGSLIVGMVSLAGMLFWKKRAPKSISFIPSALFSVIIGTVTAFLLSATQNPTLALGTQHLVNVPAVFQNGLFESVFASPSFDQLLNPLIYKTALMIAIVGSIESLLTIQALDRMAPRREVISFSRELIAQGTGNTVAGLLGGIPVSSSLARGAVNMNAGAQSKFSGVLQGLWILIAVLFFSQAMNIIPVAALAAILIATGIQLIDLEVVKNIFKRGWYQIVPFVITLVGILFIDLLVGIMFGMISAFLFILRSSYYESAFKTSNFGKVFRITFGEDVSFMMKAKLSTVLNGIEEGTIVEIDGSKAVHIDSEIIDIISDYTKEAKLKNITVVIGGISALAHLKQEVYQAMNKQYDALINNNKDWVREKTAEDPEFFSRLGQGQAPQFLFIGCSDSRVPLETITKAEPGDMFIHRNIANVVNLSDVNFLSVLQYSVEVLNVRHIIVCGHYQCGGVKTALAHKSLGLIDNWILNVKMSFKDHQNELASITDPVKREQRAIELHSIHQARSLYMNPVVQKSIQTYGFPKIHSWVYDIGSGLIKELEVKPLDQELNNVFKFNL